MLQIIVKTELEAAELRIMKILHWNQQLDTAPETLDLVGAYQMAEKSFFLHAALAQPKVYPGSHHILTFSIHLE